MLQAALKNKIRSSLQIEDEITSIVFGSLDYVNDPKMTWLFFRRLIETAGGEAPRISAPTGVEFYFWNREFLSRRIPDSSISAVEPDVIVRFATENGPLNLIIEVKWNAPLAPPCELARQWIHRNQVMADGDWLHFYIARTKTASNNAVDRSLNGLFNECGTEPGNTCSFTTCPKFQNCGYKLPGSELKKTNWRDKLFPISWNQVQTVAAGLHDARKWGEAIVSFLQHQGIFPFIGFSHISFEAVDFDREKIRFYSAAPWFALSPSRLGEHSGTTRFYSMGEKE